MASQDYKDGGSTGLVPVATATTDIFSLAADIDLPAVGTLFPDLTGLKSLSSSNESEVIPAEEQDQMFRALQRVLSKTEGDEDAFDTRELRNALESADVAAQEGQRGPQLLGGVAAILQKLWQSESQYLVEAADALANASRDPSWRIPFGQSGVLQFFLQLISIPEVNKDLLFHSLRLIGNSCADTDENREIVVSNNYTRAIMRLVLNPELAHVAIPVIYNICNEFEPAQAQVAANRLGYVLLKQINDGAITGNALLNFTYELVELTAGQAAGIENSPDGTIVLIMAIALKEDTTFAQYTCLVTCLEQYMQTERFQVASIRHKLVEHITSVLQRSFSIEVNESVTEDVQLLNQLRLKLNQTLADISALPLFLETYPVGSPLLDTLQSWLTGRGDTLQICACVVLGNVARTDEICQLMISQLNIHRSLIHILKTNTIGGVLHAALGFLKNLSIAESNREKLGEADIIPAVSKVWTYDTVPQVQLAAVSVTRLVIASNIKNITRLLTSLSSDPDSPAHSRTYLSMLLSLCGRTDTAPIKTEIGRIICSLCRTLLSRSKASEVDDAETARLLDRLFDLHEDIARPLGAMITQTEWPVVRSEGWFALALMASHDKGCPAVVDCLIDTDIYTQVEKSLDVADDESAATNEQLQRRGDRDNLVIMVKELLGRDPESLPEGKKKRLRELMDRAVASLS
ncbi:GTP binding protein, putative [Talaromyces stipitatus ATCC 10500]|uniref:GTP binding protein, putative n=1 Tax=Talaromyces stipitatus (strain ATCC 10500 / CBS 375.48 / QM 6759 / NRRL 1006) TaxID=441959 RepID=B8MA20_TALSN|nr:GTP binding protein, putative [Talaromyces stipitatus ATCC 10500]EED18349.1 GTP binding protein, putative [Talaromyces stipitatus ATCC 10500]